MNHTFDVVDEKVAEVEFFLRKMSKTHDMFEFKCFLSAFLSASRTTTLALQQFKEEIKGFEEWYEPHRNRLKDDQISRYFLDIRNEHIHGGPSPVSGARYHKGKVNYYFSKPIDQKNRYFEDIVPVCLKYFITLLEVVYDCYEKLGVYIDPQQYYTKEHFWGDIEQAEVEVWGWVMESLVEEGYDEDARWHELRGHVGECEINHLFYSYLGKPTPQPLEPEHYKDFEYTPEEKGWLHVPAGFKSIKAYQTYLRKNRIQTIIPN